MVGVGLELRGGDDRAGGDILVAQGVIQFDFSLLHHGVVPSRRRQNGFFLLRLLLLRNGELLAGATLLPQFIHLILEVLELLGNPLRLIRCLLFLGC